MAAAHDATAISVRQFLRLVKTDFAAMAAALENGELGKRFGLFAEERAGLAALGSPRVSCHFDGRRSSRGGRWAGLPIAFAHSNSSGSLGFMVNSQKVPAQ